MKQIFAAFVAIWYLVSVMGLDIHADVEHGHIHVVPAFMAQSCEMIHPSEHCHETEGCNCCHHDGCDEDEDCCTDDFESVSITGTDPGCQHMQQLQTATAITVFIPFSEKSAAPDLYRRVTAKGPPLAPPDISVLNCVFRA